jgi:hypothetical protein
MREEKIIMTDVVRILGLDDDNHAPMFRMETGEIFNTPRELIEFLSHSHDVEYQVKMFGIAWEWSTCLEEKFSYREVEMMFDYLEGLSSSLPDGVTSDATFELFWESANKEWW